MKAAEFLKLVRDLFKDEAYYFQLEIKNSFTDYEGNPKDEELEYWLYVSFPKPENVENHRDSLGFSGKNLQEIYDKIVPKTISIEDKIKSL